MPVSSLFKSYDPYDGAVPDPNTGLSQPTQLRLPGLFLMSHVAVRGGIVGTLSGLGVGVVAASTKRLEHGLLAGGGRLGFLGLCGGAAAGVGLSLYRAATDETMNDQGVRTAGNNLFDHGVSPWPILSQNAYVQGKIDKWSLGGAMGAAMAGFQAKRPLDASRCVPWGIAAMMAAIVITEQVEASARRSRKERE
jgi:hypothetical protein|tara:strand:+ start:216 stop:797 length:582 start_codon:yes stop_codon:yes gene_type:complete